MLAGLQVPACQPKALEAVQPLALTAHLTRKRTGFWAAGSAAGCSSAFGGLAAAPRWLLPSVWGLLQPLGDPGWPGTAAPAMALAETSCLEDTLLVGALDR